MAGTTSQPAPSPPRSDPDRPPSTEERTPFTPANGILEGVAPRTLEPAFNANRPRNRTPIPRWLRHALRVCFQLTLDTVSIVAAYRVAYEIRFHWQPWLDRFPISGVDPGWRFYHQALPALIPLWLGIFWYSAQLYTKPWRRSADRFLLILKGGLLGALMTLSASYIYDRTGFSRQMLLAAVPILTGLVWLSETLVLWLDGRIARFESTSPLLLIGSGRVAELIRENLEGRHPGILIHEREDLTEVEPLVRTAAAAHISEIVVVPNANSHGRLLELAEACESAGISVKMIPDLLELRLGEIQMDDSLGLPAYRLQHTSLSPAHYAVKRIFDFLLSLGILTVAAIPFALLALLIRLDSPGPILYRQRRLGYKGCLFNLFKFRTMVTDAESQIDRIKTLSNDQAGGFFKAKGDPRVTRMGRFLRRYSLDEFPQFLNVLRGEMSVVGPRPLAAATGELGELSGEFGPTAKKRFNILPGITGLWQVSGRSDVSSQQRFALDLFYIEHWSLGLDLQIILKTIPAMLGGKGAY